MQQQLSHQSLNVRPIRARILGHLHHDSFDYYFTPFRGCVWKCSPSASPWDTRPPPPLAQSACWGVSGGWKLDKAPPISQPPTLPPLSRSLTTPYNRLSQRFSLGTRGWSICFLGPCFHPQAPVLSLCPPWTQSASADSVCVPLSHTYSILWWQRHTHTHSPSLVLYFCGSTMKM